MTKNKKIRLMLQNKYVLKTFNQWNKSGYKIKKGSKSRCRSEHGEALFTCKQVEKREMSSDYWHSIFDTF